MPDSQLNHSSRGNLWHWFVLSAVGPLVHSASRLSLDLWHDEIYTVDYFVRRGPAFLVTDYSAPNNHVLYSLILWPFFLLSDNNFMLRLPSFLFTLGTLGVVFSLARRYGGLTCAVISTSLLGLNQMFLIHTMQVRGYGLSMFLTACLAWLALPGTGDARWPRFLAVVLAGAALLYVMPTNVLFFVPLAVSSVSAALVRRWSARQLVAEISSWAAAVLLAMVCYLPIAGQVLSAKESSSPSTWTRLPVIATSFFRPATFDYGWFAPLFLVGLIALVFSRCVDHVRWTLPVASLGVVVGAFLVTGLLHISPFERNYCPLLVFLALSAGWLLAELAETIRGWLVPRCSPSSAAGISLAVISILLWPQLWTYPQRLKARREQSSPADQWVTDGYYCYYAADYRPSTVVRYLLDQGIENAAYQVCYTDRDALNVAYYFARSGLPVDKPAEGRSTAPSTLFAILPEPPPLRMLAEDRAISYEQLRMLHLVEDFGYYRLYQSSQQFDVSKPSDVDPALQRPAASAQ